MTTNEMTKILGETLKRKSGNGAVNTWITNDGIDITEGIKSGGRALIMISDRECGVERWTTADGAKNTLDQIRNTYH